GLGLAIASTRTAAPAVPDVDPVIVLPDDRQPEQLRVQPGQGVRVGTVEHHRTKRPIMQGPPPSRSLCASQPPTRVRQNRRPSSFVSGALLIHLASCLELAV